MEIVTTTPHHRIERLRTLEYLDCDGGCTFDEVLIGGRRFFRLPRRLDCDLCIARIAAEARARQIDLLWLGAVA